MEPEVSLQHGAQVLGHVGHAGVESRHQARVEGQKIQPARERGSGPTLPLVVKEGHRAEAVCFHDNVKLRLLAGTKKNKL